MTDEQRRSSAYPAEPRPSLRGVASLGISLDSLGVHHDPSWRALGRLLGATNRRVFGDTSATFQLARADAWMAAAVLGVDEHALADLLLDVDVLAFGMKEPPNDEGGRGLGQGDLFDQDEVGGAARSATIVPLRAEPVAQLARLRTERSAADLASPVTPPPQSRPRFTVEELVRASLTRLAIERGDFFCVFQPIVDLATNEIVGAEALVRCRDPQFGLLEPEELVGLAIECELLDQLVVAVLGEACRAAAQWPEGRSGARFVAIRLSAEQLPDGVIAAAVVAAITSSGLTPSRLVFEITASAALTAADPAAATLRVLRDAGLRLFLDDLGTGASSLARLVALAVDGVKIERGLVDDLGNGARSAAVVGGIVAIADDLGITSIAEGIEDDTQHARLVALRCTFGQGPYFSEPLASAEFRRLLLEWPDAPASGEGSRWTRVAPRRWRMRLLTRRRGVAPRSPSVSGGHASPVPADEHRAP